MAQGATVKGAPQITASRDERRDEGTSTVTSEQTSQWQAAADAEEASLAGGEQSHRYATTRPYSILLFSLLATIGAYLLVTGWVWAIENGVAAGWIAPPPDVRAAAAQIGG